MTKKLVALAVVLAMVVGVSTLSRRIDDLHLEVASARLEILHLHDQIARLAEAQEAWLAQFEVRRVTVTAYAPLDPLAVEGMCFSGDPNVTASGAPPVPGETAAGGRAYRLGTRVWIAGHGWRTINDRGGQVRGYAIDLVKATQREALEHGRQQLVVVFERP